MITLAGVINALKLVGKKLAEVKIVTSGAGAAGIAIIRLLISTAGMTSSPRPIATSYSNALILSLIHIYAGLRDAKSIEASFINDGSVPDSIRAALEQVCNDFGAGVYGLSLIHI